MRQRIESVKGPRTTALDVSGNTRLKNELQIREKAFLTIAGQTAPNDGITGCDQKLNISKSHDITIRYVRARLGDKDRGDSRPKRPNLNRQNM